MTEFIAHRGYSKYERENTIPAFIKAGECDYFFGIETDVHATLDNVFVVMHDENTSRVTNNSLDFNIEEHNYDEVNKIILPDLDNSYKRSDIYIPKMIEYFNICKKYNKVAVCELKQTFNIEQIKEILKIINNIDYLDNTIFISFNYDNLAKVRELNRNVRLQFLTGDFKNEYYQMMVDINASLDIYYGSLTKEIVDKCHKYNLLVNCWTVDDIIKAKELMDIGVDYITSNWINSNDVK